MAALNFRIQYTQKDKRKQVEKTASRKASAGNFVIAFCRIICLYSCESRLFFDANLDLKKDKTMVNSVLTAEATERHHNAKAIARGILDELPDDCTLEDIMLEIYIRASILESREQITAGKGFSLAEARRELDSWFKSLSPPNLSFS